MKHFKIAFDVKAISLGDVLATIDPLPIDGLSVTVHESHSTKNEGDLTNYQALYMKPFEHSTLCRPVDMGKAANHEKPYTHVIRSLIERNLIKRAGRGLYKKVG